MTRTFLPTLAVLATVLTAAAGAHAQMSNAQPSSSQPTSSQTSPSAPAGSGALAPADRAFLQQTAQGSGYELAIAQLAAQHAADPDIRQYAQTIVSDHEQLNTSLQKLAQDKGLQLNTTPTAKEQSTLARLQGLNGHAFDKVYLAEVTRINRQDKGQLRKEVNGTRDPDVKSFAQQMQAADARHEQTGKALKAKV